MDEVCGYLDDIGGFHNSKKEAEVANIKVRIAELQHALKNFESHLERELVNSKTIPPINHYDAFRYKDEVLKIVLKQIIRDSDIFINIINHKEELEKELKLLLEKKELRLKWWEKIIWWNN